VYWPGCPWPVVISKERTFTPALEKKVSIWSAFHVGNPLAVILNFAAVLRTS
jgi:hypothetical protein